MPFDSREKNKLAAAVSFACLQISAQSLAQTQPNQSPTQTLGTVVVTTQTPVADPNIPSPTETVTAKQLENRNVINVEDAVSDMPNMHVRKRFIGDRNSIISTRSTSSRQSARGLVYADGLLLSNLLGSDFNFPPQWSVVSPEEISRVDVIYGPYSAAYPGNSLGATILIGTKMPKQFEGDVKVQAFSQRFDLYGIHDTYDGNQANAYFGDRKGNFSWLITLDRLENDSQPLSFATLPISTTPGSGTPVTGAYFDRDQTGANRVVLGVNSEGVTHTVLNQAKIKLTYDFTPTLKSDFTLVHWEQKASSTTTPFLRDSNGNPVYQGSVNIGGFQYTLPASTFAPSNSEGERWLYGATLKTQNDKGWNYQAIASFFDITKDITRTASGPGSGPGTVAFGNDTGWKSLDLKADRRPNVALNGHWLSAGYHYDNYKLDNRTYNSPDWQAQQLSTLNNTFAGKTQTQALFLQDAWQFAKAFKLNVGTRYEQWKAYDGSRTTATNSPPPYADREESHWSPKTSIEYLPNDDWLIRLSLGKAYRFPTVSEMFQGRVVGNNITNNNPDLKPEHAFSKDLTFERLLEKGKVRLSFYEDDVRNVIFSQTFISGASTVTNIQNVDRVRTRGAEVAYEAQSVYVKGLDIMASLAYNDAITLENSINQSYVGHHFYRIPLWRADLVATYRQNTQWAYTLAARYSGRQWNTLDNTDVNPDTFGGTSSFTVLDAKISYDAMKNVKLGLGVNNLTDQRYYVFHPYPGRTVYAEAKISF